MDDLTWTCHVCNQVRPDSKISVRTKRKRIGSVEFDENIRYCNDRPECVEGSKTRTFTSGEDVQTKGY